MGGMNHVQQGLRARYAAAGLLAAVAGMSAGHLLAALVDPASSPVVAVGSTVIDSVPTPVKDWAVRTLGTADKPVLVGSVAFVTLVAAALAGLLSRTRPSWANVALVVLAALAGLAAVTRPAPSPIAFAPALLTALVGLGVLHWLGTLARRSEPPAGDPVESPLDHSAQAPGVAGTPARRSFLLGAAGVTVGAAAVGALGQRLSVVPTPPSTITLPRPLTTIPDLPAGIEGAVKGVTPFRTPIDRFYRIDTALVIPRVDVADWKLEVDGLVERPFSLTFDELMRMPMVEDDITLNCVSNEVGGPYISSTRWLGVRVRDILERAGVKATADQVLSESVDGMTISTPVEALTDDRGAMIAVAMGGAPLTPKHGFPARLVTPGLYGFVGATKWLTRLTATTYAAEQAYWTRRGWATDGTVKTQARIDTPMGLGTYPPGKVAVGGVAWAQGRGIGKVEVRVDGGPWNQATLGADAGTDYWRQWHWVWEAGSGRHELTVRATDGTGTVQTEERAEPYPGGAAGYHSIVVVVE